jgi:hypothetical protein
LELDGSAERVADGEAEESGVATALARRIAGDGVNEVVSRLGHVRAGPN